MSAKIGDATSYYRSQFNELLIANLLIGSDFELLKISRRKDIVSMIILKDVILKSRNQLHTSERNVALVCESAQFSKLFDPILTQRVTSSTGCTLSTRIFSVSFRHHLITINRSMTVLFQSNGLIIFSNMSGSRENDTCDVLDYHPKQIAMAYFST